MMVYNGDIGKRWNKHKTKTKKFQKTVDFPKPILYNKGVKRKENNNTNRIRSDLDQSGGTLKSKYSGRTQGQEWQPGAYNKYRIGPKFPQPVLRSRHEIPSVWCEHIPSFQTRSHHSQSNSWF